MSWQMRAVGGYVRATRKRRYRTEAGGQRFLAAAKGSPEPPARTVRGLQHGRYDVGGFAVHTLATPGVSADAGTLVYLHGGAFVGEVDPRHWGLVAELVRVVGCRAVVPIYGLAPAHDASQARGFLLALAAGLSGRVHVAGDSAGGGLALALAQIWPGPAPLVGLTLIAPWLDLEMANPEIDAVERIDPWLTRPGLRVAAAAWAGDLPLDDPWVSPLHGPVDRLPPTDLHVGTHDITLPDCRLLRSRVPTLHYDEVPGALHVHPLLPTPEGRRARLLIADRLRTTLLPTP